MNGAAQDMNNQQMLIAFEASAARLRESHAELLAAAKAVLHIAFSRELLVDDARVYLALEAAIAHAEESSP